MSEDKHITKTDGVCGGKACIAGHRVRVMDIVALSEMRDLSADEIVQQFPGITLADVYAALAYYLEIQADFKRDEEVAASLRQLFPSKLREKLGG